MTPINPAVSHQCAKLRYATEAKFAILDKGHDGTSLPRRDGVEIN